MDKAEGFSNVSVLRTPLTDERRSDSYESPFGITEAAFAARSIRRWQHPAYSRDTAKRLLDDASPLVFTKSPEESRGNAYKIRTLAIVEADETTEHEDTNETSIFLKEAIEFLPEDSDERNALTILLAMHRTQIREDTIVEPGVIAGRIIQQYSARTQYEQ